MKSIYKNLILVFLLLFMSHTIYAGGGDRIGTSGAAQLAVPVGARGLAMGSSNIASVSGIDALYWNPAGITGSNSSVDVSFSHMTHIADIGIEYGAVTANVEGFGVLGFNIKAMSIGEINETTAQYPDGTGATFTPQMMVAGITYARALTDNISVGLTGNLISETLGRTSATGVAFSIGVIYQNLGQINGLDFGIAVKNLGPQMAYDGPGLYYQADVGDLNRPPHEYKANSAAFELPSSFELGFAYTPMYDDMNQLNLTGSFQSNNFSADEYKLGAEYGFNELLYVRGGYMFTPNIESEEQIYGMSAGVGVNYSLESFAVKVDYTYRQVEYFDGAHMVQVSLGF